MLYLLSNRQSCVVLYIDTEKDMFILNGMGCNDKEECVVLLRQWLNDYYSNPRLYHDPGLQRYYIGGNVSITKIETSNKQNSEIYHFIQNYNNTTIKEKNEIENKLYNIVSNNSDTFGYTQFGFMESDVL